jgi:hypothetical protein
LNCNNHILTGILRFSFLKGAGRRLLLILLTLLTVATAMAQKPVTRIEVDQCESYEFSVVNWPGDRYTWDLYTELQWDTVNFAKQNGNLPPVPYFEGGNYGGSSVRISGLEPGRYFLRVMVWDEVSCTNNLLVFLLDVIEYKPEFTLVGDSVCYGEPVVFKIIFSGTGPWEVEYTYGDGSSVLNMNGDVSEIEFTPPVTIKQTTDIWITKIINRCIEEIVGTPEKARVVIFPIPTQSKIYPVEK